MPESETAEMMAQILEAYTAEYFRVSRRGAALKVAENINIRNTEEAVLRP